LLMNARSSWAGGSLVTLALVVWVLAPAALGKGAPRASAPHSSGGGYHAPHVSAPRPQVYHMPSTPRQNFSRQMPHVNMNAGAHRNTSAHLNASATPHVSSAARGIPRGTVLRNNTTRNINARNSVNRGLAAAGATVGVTNINRTRVASAYAPYGYRGGIRRNRGYSSRSRYYGRRSYGYGNRNYQAQQFNRMLAQQLRTAHRNLAQLDREYQGHRVRAMRATSLAIRQLGGRSTYYRGMNAFGNAGQANNGLRNRAGVNGGAGVARMSQAQADAWVRRSQRILMAVNQQLTARGYTQRHVRSRAYVQTGMQELNTALTVR
jgi:hypothetical protein